MTNKKLPILILAIILLVLFSIQTNAAVSAQFPLTLVKINETLSVWNVSNNFVFLSNSINNVGIGTTSPNTKLTVIGGINASGGLNVTTGDVLLATTSGNVGIGTASPSQPLHVYGATDNLALFESSDSGDAWISTKTGSVQTYFVADAGASKGIIGTLSTHPFSLRTNNVDRVTIDTTGRVGIDTINPATVLDVKGKANFTGNFSIMNDSDTIFFVDNTSRRVGIGTTNPLLNLHIQKSDVAFTPNTDLDTMIIENVGNNILQIVGTGGTTGIGFSDTNRNVGSIFYSHSDDSMQFTTGGGAEKMRIDVTGKVGIGTISPLATLHVNGTGAQGGLLVTNDSGTKVFFVNSTSGNVGIGTASTDVYKLNVKGDINGSDIHSYSNIFIDVNAGGLLAPNEDNTYIQFKAQDNGIGRVEVARIQGATDPYFQATNLYSFVESGRVGIATSSPATILDVKGKANFTGNFSIMNASDTLFFVDNTSGNVGIGVTVPGKKLDVKGDISIQSTYGLRLADNQFVAWISGGGASGTFRVGSTNDLDLSFYAGGADKVYIDATNGNVGIGTTNPLFPLTVVGTMNATRLNGTLDCTMIGGGTDANFCVDADSGGSPDTSSYFNNENFTIRYDLRADRWQIANSSNYLATIGYIKGSDFNTQNISNITAWENIRNIPSLSNFQLSNVSNNTLTKGDNATLALWNASGNNIFLREITGNVGIGTTAPSSTLEIGSETGTGGNFSVKGKTNSTIGNFTILQYNASCAGFKFNTTGGGLFSCMP